MRGYKSRKFLLSVAAFGLVVLNEIVGLGIDPAAYDSIVQSVLIYIGAEGAVDAAHAFSNRNGGGEL